MTPHRPRSSHTLGDAEALWLLVAEIDLWLVHFASAPARSGGSSLERTRIEVAAVENGRTVFQQALDAFAAEKIFSGPWHSALGRPFPLLPYLRPARLRGAALSGSGGSTVLL